MKAMILAAGYGTRLRPLTNEKPKALIEIYGKPILELIILKLIASGVDEIIINTHHFPEQIEAFLQRHRNYDIAIELSYEPEILGTGGGLLNVRHFFTGTAPFIVHNVDILSTIDLADMYQYHLENNALATLAIQQRKSSRTFIVDDRHFICGHHDADNQRVRLRRQPFGNTHLMAFCGIHVISPALFQKTTATGRCSIVDIYLELIGQGEPIIGFQADQYYWRDIGRYETLHQIEKDLATGEIKFNDLLM